MRTFFTVAEYNPFHNGHQYHIRAMRNAGATHVAAVMSGNFVQRGEPALLNKFKRAEMAVCGGADLILELPLPWSMAPAERFAFGAVRLVCASGIADGFSFGCEANDPSLLFGAAERLADEEMRNTILSLRKNCSYPAAVASVMPKEYADAVSDPNNILGIEYIQKLREQGFAGEIVPVKRCGVGHDSDRPCDDIASASFLRDAVKSGVGYASFLPKSTLSVLQNAIDRGDYADSYERQLISLLRLHNRDFFRSLPFSDGGIGDRLYHAVRSETTLEDIYAAVKSKRFTHASVRRLVLNAALQVPGEFCKQEPPYIRVLAFNEKGKELLHLMSERAAFPVVMRKSDIEKLDTFAKKVYALECRAGDLYNSFLKNMRPCGTEMTDHIYMEFKQNNE